MSSSTWQAFLTAQGAQFDDHTQAVFADHTYAERLYDLSSLGLIAVSGADALVFLQGQLTNDIKQLSDAAQYTGYCTAKGRLLAIFYAHMHADTYYLQCPRPLVPMLVKRLSMFVMRSKVVISDVSDVFVAMGLSAPALNHVGVADSIHRVQETGAGMVSIRLPDSADLQRAQLWVAATQAEQVWTQLRERFTPSSSESWEALEIQAGIPHIVNRTQEQFVPQMVNLDALDGINFKKGCYTGQEIVARTHYLGKVKRRSLLATVASQQPPQAGDPLQDAQGQEAGRLVRVAAKDQNSYWLLAECRLEAREAGPIFWQGQALQFETLPYALP